jgi:hypothetical protein
MKKILAKILCMALFGAILTGCYPYHTKYAEDLNVVYTSYNENFNFKAQSTYALPDSIVTDVDIVDGNTTYTFMDAKYATPLLQTIESNMNAMGWKKVDISQKPSVALTVGAMASTNYYYSYWYNWWYGGYYYGWYYPPYYTVSSYTTGSLIITMSASSEDSPLHTGQAAWIGALNGILTGNYSITNISGGIDQAFKQSPYLKIN